MIKNNIQFHRFLPLLLTVLLLLISGGAIIGSPSGLFTNSASAADHTLNYTVDRSQLPQMNYYNLTYNIYVGEATTVTVKNGSDQTLPSSYDSGTNILTLTTDETTFSVTLNDFTGSTDDVGEIKVAPLKDNKLWAWSHGFDDNQQFLKAIYYFEQYNLPATLYLNDYESGFGNVITDNGKTNPTDPTTACDINNSTADPNTECFIILQSKIIQLFEDGWALGNHTEDHTCWAVDINGNSINQPSDEELWQDITNLDAKYQSKIISGSTRSDYLINSFAAPCFNDYNDLIQAKIAAEETEIIMSEGGERDYSSPDDFIGTANELPLQLGFDFSAEVIRDIQIEGVMNNDSDDDASLTFVQGMFDWLHNNATADGPVIYWYNSISHGRNEAVFATAIPYLINNYGSGSQFDEVWIATAEEIYAYTYMREKAVITLECSSTVGNCAQNPVVLPDIVPSDRQIYGRVFNDLNQNGLDDNEPGIPDVRVNYWVDDNCDGTWSFETDYGRAVTTKADGSYLFDGLNPSHCYFAQISEDTVTNYTATSKDIGTNDNIDSDFHNNLYTDQISLPSQLVNLGLVENSGTSTPTPTPTLTSESNQIFGRVFNDLNQNGIDDNEPGIAGVRIIHWIDWDCNGIDFGDPNSYLGDQTSSLDGSYQFTGLDPTPGYCFFAQIDLSSTAGLTLTIPNNGEDSKDSDFYPSNGYTDPIQLPGQNINAGFYDSTLPTPTPTETIEATPTPSPTPIPAGLTQQNIFSTGQFDPNFVTDYTAGTQYGIFNNNLQVTYQNDHGFLSIRHWQKGIENVVALNFDVRSASFAAKALIAWIDENGIIIADNKQLLDICPGNYIITQNIPENVSGFTLQEYSGERLTVEHHSFELDNISFLIHDNLASPITVEQSVPNCPINTIHLPVIVR